MEGIAYAIYLFVLIISPLLFGAVHAYAYTLVYLLVLAAAFLLVVHNMRRDYKTNSLYFQYPETRLNVLICLIFVFLVLQTMVQPAFLVKLFSPQAFSVQGRAAELVGQKESITLAPYIYPVRMSLLRWSVYGLFFIGLSQVLNSRKRIEILCFCILITASFISTYGIYQAYAGDNLIWWFSGHGGNVRGTFINRNHFAGFMAMALMLATAFASSLGVKHFRQNNAAANARISMHKFLSLEQNYSKQALIIFCGVIIGLGLVLSASRGGIISAGVGLLLLALLYVCRRNLRKNGFVVLVIFLLISGYGLQVGLEHTIDRFQPEQLQSSLDNRFRYARKTLDVFKDYKLAGVGIGNFQHAYPRYQSPEDKGLLIDYAHNDWAQLLAESGLTGIIITLAGMGLFVFAIVRQWKDRRDPRALALGVVPLAVLTTMGVHSWFDFNMHIPANVLLLAALLAVGQASLSIRLQLFGETSQITWRRVNTRPGNIVLVSALLLIIAWNMSWAVRHFAAESYCNTVPNSTLIRDKSPAPAEILKAVGWDRFNAAYWFKLAQAKKRERTGQNNSLEEVTAALEKAVLLNPLSPVYYLELGWAYSRRWRDADFADKWLPKADMAMDLAGLYSGARDPGLHNEVANYWLMRSKTLAAVSDARHAALGKMILHYRKALDLERGVKREKMKEDIRATVWNYYPDPEIWEKIVGRRQ